MFSANTHAAMNAYRKVGVESIVDSSTPHQLVLMLFGGARAAVAAAKLHIERHETAAKCEAIAKAVAIIDGGLKVSLDLRVGGELANNLFDLYAYMTQRLVQANLKNDSSVLEEVAQLLAQLGSAWEAIGVKPASTKPETAIPAQSPSHVSRVAAAYGVR